MHRKRWGSQIKTWNLLIGILFSFCVNGQSSIPKDFNQSLYQCVFDVGGPNQFTKDCQLLFECDCCRSELLFLEDKRVYYLSFCRYDTSVALGHLTQKSGQRIEIILTGDWVKKRHLSKPDESQVRYTSSFTKETLLSFEIVECDGRRILHDKTNHQYAIPSERKPWSVNVSDMTEILDWYHWRYRDLNGEVFPYSKDGEQAIINAYYHYLESSLIEDYDPHTGWIYTNMGGWSEDGQVLKSKDRSFKLFSFTGDLNIGGHNEHRVASIIQMPDGSMVVTDLKANELYQTGSNSYAALSNTYYGGSYSLGITLFSQFKIADGKVVEVPLFDSSYLIEPTDDRYPFRPNEFKIECPWYYSKETYLEYDEQKGILSYQLVLDDHSYWNTQLFQLVPEKDKVLKEDEILVLTGTLTIKEGKVVDHKEEWEKIAKEDE